MVTNDSQHTERSNLSEVRDIFYKVDHILTNMRVLMSHMTIVF